MEERYMILGDKVLDCGCYIYQGKNGEIIYHKCDQNIDLTLSPKEVYAFGMDIFSIEDLDIKKYINYYYGKKNV